MSSRSVRRISWACVAILIAVHAWAGEAPIPVSPGEANHRSAVDRACPTFTWTAVDHAGHYELAVFAVAGSDSTAVHSPGAEQRPVLIQRLPGGATAWTPPAGRCLAEGGAYAWQVRAVGPGLDEAWSEPSWFTIETGWSDEQLDRLLGLLAARAEKGDPGSSEVLETLQSLRQAAPGDGMLFGARGTGALTGNPTFTGTESRASAQLKGGPPEYGIHAEHAGTYSIAVAGHTTAETGNTKGVQGISQSVSGVGVEGLATSDYPDVIGVRGEAFSELGYGVVGVQTGYSIADDPSGYRAGGFFAGDNGVVGYSNEIQGRGVFGYQASSSGGGWAGYFESQSDGVYITTPSGQTGLQVMGGTKSAAVPTNSGHRLLYTEESTEVWFSDYGFAGTEGDRVLVDIDPLYAETVNLERPYHVFLTAYGNAELYVSQRRPDGFEVRVRSGERDVPFSYRIVAKRRQFEDQRLEPAAVGDDGPNQKAALSTNQISGAAALPSTPAPMPQGAQ